MHFPETSGELEVDRNWIRRIPFDLFTEAVGTSAVRVAQHLTWCFAQVDIDSTTGVTQERKTGLLFPP